MKSVTWITQVHRGEAMYISLIDSHDIAQKVVLNSLFIHHFIIITCIKYEVIFTISLPKLINIASVQTCVIRVTDSIRHSNTDYSGLEWNNINIFGGKLIFIADAGNHNLLVNH